MMSIGFDDGGCLRCCALKKTECTLSTDSYYSSTGLTAWAISVMCVVGLCIFFTFLYMVTSKRRNEGMAFQAFTSNSYFVQLPVAQHASLTTEANENAEEDVAVSDTVFLVNKAESDADAVPVARRTVTPVVGVRRPMTLAQAQQNIFFLDSEVAASAAEARNSR